MNAIELKKKLKEMGVSEYDYRILGEKSPNEAFCLIYEDSLWKIYYGERGHRTGLKEFTNEEDACEYFLKEIKESCHIT